MNSSSSIQPAESAQQNPVEDEVVYYAWSQLLMQSQQTWTALILSWKSS